MHFPTSKTTSSRLLSAQRDLLVQVLESIQDLIIVSLCIGLFSFMLLQLREMFLSLLPPLDFQVVTADILFLLILVELFRLLIIYLQEQRVSIGVAVEVSIVSVLREVIVRGVLETPWSQILSACAFLLVMGALLIIRVWLPPTFEGIDPEKRLSLRRKLERDELSADSPLAAMEPSFIGTHSLLENRQVIHHDGSFS
jgi:uncharacterized membrane protein (DUF373 family)